AVGDRLRRSPHRGGPRDRLPAGRHLDALVPGRGDAVPGLVVLHAGQGRPRRAGVDGAGLTHRPGPGRPHPQRARPLRSGV
ncbi:MAG: hypothetical protein AVDCRST_MAG47-2463, partial [uncultured Nocardioidaceae bacterium]